MIIILSIAFLLENKCNNHFCYLHEETTNGWKLIGFSPNFDFSIYGESTSEPLNLSPQFDDNAPLTSIDYKFFTPKYPISLIIPNTLKYIASYSFYRVDDISLELTLGDELIIENGAFQECQGLTSINFSGCVKKIGDHSFHNCQNLIFISMINAETISEYAFADCNSIECEIKFSNNTKTIGQYSFAFDVKLYGDLELPDSIESIGEHAFHICADLNGFLKLPNNITKINDYTFFWCSSLCGELVIPESVEHIGSFSFFSCIYLSGQLIIPNNVKSIGNSAFYNCVFFEGDLKIPDSVTSIGTAAFSDC